MVVTVAAAVASPGYPSTPAPVELERTRRSALIDYYASNMAEGSLLEPLSICRWWYIACWLVIGAFMEVMR